MHPSPNEEEWAAKLRRERDTLLQQGGELNPPPLYNLGAPPMAKKSDKFYVAVIPGDGGNESFKIEADRYTHEATEDGELYTFFLNDEIVAKIRPGENATVIVGNPNHVK